MTLCKGMAPPPKGRSNVHAQRCGALPVEGFEYCAAHLAIRGMRYCRDHGWVQPQASHDYSGPGRLPVTTVWCPNLIDGEWCRPWGWAVPA